MVCMQVLVCERAGGPQGLAGGFSKQEPRAGHSQPWLTTSCFNCDHGLVPDSQAIPR